MQTLSQLFFSSSYSLIHSQNITGAWYGSLYDSSDKTEYTIKLLITTDMAKQNKAQLVIKDSINSSKHNLDFIIKENELKFKDNNFNIQGNPKLTSFLRAKFKNIYLFNPFCKVACVAFVNKHTKDNINCLLTKLESNQVLDEAAFKTNDCFKINISKDLNRDDLIKQIDDAIKFGKVFNEKRLPQNKWTWFRVPNKLAGKIQMFVSSISSPNFDSESLRFYNAPYLSTTEFGCIKDKSGQIWDKVDFPILKCREYTVGSDQYKTKAYIYAIEFYSINHNTLTRESLIFHFKVKSNNNIIFELDKEFWLDKFSFNDDNSIERIGQMSEFDSSNKKVFSHQLFQEGKKIDNFLENCNKSTKQDFIQYLKDKDLNDLIPD